MDPCSTVDTLLSWDCWYLHGSCEYSHHMLGLRACTDLFRILFNVLYCAKINRDKRNGKYDQYAGYDDDRNPEFMMVL